MRSVCPKLSHNRTSGLVLRSMSHLSIVAVRYTVPPPSLQSKHLNSSIDTYAINILSYILFFRYLFSRGGGYGDAPIRCSIGNRKAN